MSDYRPRYSRALSKPFWARVAVLDDEAAHDTVYALGVALQNLEAQVLRALQHAEQDQRLRAVKPDA